MKQTMLGVGVVPAAASSSPAPAQPAAAKRPFAGTMLGMPAPNAAPPATPAPAYPQQQPPAYPPQQQPPAYPPPPQQQPYAPQQQQQPAAPAAGRPKGNLLASTMVGVMPTPAPAAPEPQKRMLASTMVDVAHAAPAPPPPAPPTPIAGAPMVSAPQAGAAKRPLAQTAVGLASPVAQGQPAQPRNRNLPKSTIMGVALPGIAPTHGEGPALASNAPYADPYAPQGAEPAFAPAPVFVAPPPPEAPEMPVVEAKRRSRAPAVVLLLLALVGLGAAVTYVLFMRPKPPPAMSGELAGEPSAPQLVVSCEACGAGSELELAGKTVPFAQGKATVAIDAAETSVGSHEFKGSVKVGGEKAQPFTLQVLVPFAVEPSLAPLAKGSSAVDVQVEVAPEVTSVTIDGKDAKVVEGRATRSVAIPPPDGEARTFEKVVEYAVAWKGGERKGSVKLVVPYAALKLALPGRRPIVIGAEELDVSGRATPGATVRLGAADDAATVTADKDGAFKGRAKLGATDEKLEIRAFAPKVAPRVLVLPLLRAASKAAAEKAMRAEAKDAAVAVAAPAAHVDEVVVLKADVVNVFEEDGRAGFRGDVHGKETAGGDEGIGAPVRVLLPSGVTVQKGDVVEVVGVISRAAPLAKEKGTLAEIDASFVVAKR